MNINYEIVSRALNKAGEEALTQTELDENQNRVQLIKSFYLQTILETLSQTEWTSQLKRQELEDPELVSGNQYAYKLPIDCAKPVKLLSKMEYSVEAGYLYTEDTAATLIYVSNNYTGKYKYEKDEDVKESDILNWIYTAVEVTEEEFPEGEYFIKAGEDYDIAEVYDPDQTYYTREKILINEKYFVYDEEIDDYILADGWDPEAEYFVKVDEDYPFYKDFEFDPNLSEYIETRLASKIVLKITGNTQLYQMLYSEAQLKEKAAVQSTYAHAKNKYRGNRYWTDLLGLPDYGENVNVDN